MRRANPASITMWHGARKWKGPPVVRASRTKRIVHGPGIYLTNRYETAAKYAKGGGVVMRVEIKPDLVWLEDAGAAATIEEMIAFLQERPRLPKRAEIIADLQVCTKRMYPRPCPTVVLANLMINYNALSGDHGPALAKFLADHGIQVSHVEHHSEDWVVVFDPSVILSMTPTRAKDVHSEDYDLPRIRRTK